MNTTIDQAAKELMQPDSKIGVLATLDADGWPHLSFISSLQALGEDGMTFGKFCVGYSKRNIEQRPDVGFLVLTAQMDWLWGNARYTHTSNTGPVFEEYNSKPLFRYNTYFGFDHVYFMDLVRISDIQALPMPKIITGAILTRIFGIFHAQSKKNKLRQFGTQLFGTLDSLKFVSWRSHEDGLLRIVPIIQGSSAGTDRVVFSGLPYGSDLTIPPGAKAAILCVNLQMQSVEAEGICTKSGPVHVLDIKRVYNSMPPKMEYIYPRPAKPLAVTAF